MLRNVAFIFLSLLLVSCGKGIDTEAPIGIEEHQRAMPGKEVVDTKHGKEIWFAVGVMDGVVGTPANGVAQAHVFEDGTSLITLQLNIGIPEDGFFYEAWLERWSLDPLPLGHLRSVTSDVRHQRIFESPEDLQTFTNVFVTREADDGNADPGVRVAEGVLKERER